jgi:hypothetical protein
MKFFTFFLLFSFTLISCDAPVRTRIPVTDNFESDTSGQVPGVVPVGTTTTKTGYIDQDDNTSQAGFEHCPYLDPDLDGGSVGYFGICQNENDNRVFKAIFAETSTQGNCFIPIHILDNGNSYKLGKAECVHSQPEKNYYMTLIKEAMPPSYSYPRPEQVNGVMVIKLQSVNAYMGCMNAKEDFFVATNGCCLSKTYNQSTGRYNCAQANQQCEPSANNYANNICNMFVQNHGNNYRQVNF